MMKTRKAIINHTERLMPWLQATKPKEVEILLETNSNPQPIKVTLFDFEKQLLSLLNDKELFGNINNLDINPDNPFGSYKAPGNVLSTVNSGMCYQQAYKTMIKDPDSQVLIPIIFACDETKVGSLGKATSWP